MKRIGNLLILLCVITTSLYAIKGDWPYGFASTIPNEDGYGDDKPVDFLACDNDGSCLVFGNAEYLCVWHRRWLEEWRHRGLRCQLKNNDVVDENVRKIERVYFANGEVSFVINDGSKRYYFDNIDLNDLQETSLQASREAAVAPEEEDSDSGFCNEYSAMCRSQTEELSALRLKHERELVEHIAKAAFECLVVKLYALSADESKLFICDSENNIHIFEKNQNGWCSLI